MEDCKATKDYIFIDYLKGIAIIMVILTHVGFATDTVKGNFLFPYFIYMAIPIFMLITGFNYANSYINRGCTELVQMYNIKLLLKRFLRLSIPFIIILILEYLFHFKNIINNSLIINFLRGGEGRGNYYFPVMLQIIFLYPLAYYFLKKNSRKFLWAIFILCILFEVICAYINLKNGIYRLISVRYFLYICLGTWLKLTPKINSEKLLVSFVIGINAITLFMYNPDIVSLPFNHWRHTNIMCAFYIFPIFAYIYYNYANFEWKNLWGNILRLIGKASWHIFLIQMFIFGYLYDRNIFANYCSFKSGIVIIIICIITGIAFYMAEKQIYKIFSKK